MSVLDWDGLVFYDKKIKKHIEKKFVDAGLASKEDIDDILNDYLTITDAVATYCKKTDFDALKTEVEEHAVDITISDEDYKEIKSYIFGSDN